MARLRPSVAFLLALVVLGGVGIASLSSIGTTMRTGYDYGGVHVEGERAVYAQSVVMRPGDQLVLRPELGIIFPEFESYDFYIVQGGDRFVLLDEGAPESAYAHIRNVSAQSCCGIGWVTFERPDDESWRREGQPILQGGPNFNGTYRELQVSALDQPERIDLVWVLHPREPWAPPENETEHRFLEGQLAMLIHRGEQPLPTVFAAGALSWQPAAYATMSAAALVAALAALLWAVRLGQSTKDGAASETEGLLRLHATAGEFLRSLRDLLVASALVVLLVGFHVLVINETGHVLLHMEKAGIAGPWRQALAVSLLVLYVAVVLMWSVMLFHVQRALRRWRRRAASAPPIDL